MDKFLVENGQVFRQVFSRENGQFFSRKQTSKSNLENLVLRAGNGQGQTGPVQIEGGPKTLRGGGANRTSTEERTKPVPPGETERKNIRWQK
jgi:hypothetical protein